MSLRRKTVLAFGLTSAALLVLLLALAQIILLRGFDRLQEEAVQQNILRIKNVISNELDNLNSFTGDWAYWDDTYQYVQDKNQEYADSNLNVQSISNLKVNLFLYTDLNNQLVFGETLDLKTIQALPIPDDLQPRSDLLQPVLNLPDITSTNSGILLSSEGPLLVAAKPILTSQKTGPAMGKIVFGRLLDDTKINAFSEQTQLTIGIYPLNTAEPASEFASIRSSLMASDAPSVIYTMQDQTAQGYSLLNDINGNPALILKMGMPDSIYQEGQKSVLYFVIALLISGLTFGAVVLWLLEKIVLSRLGYLNQRVHEIASSNKLSERIKMDGADELSSLTSTINNSLGIMENSQAELQQLNIQLEEKVKDLKALESYRDRFFTNASHEFRTPMAILRTQLYLAEKQPSQWQHHIDILTATTNRLSDILNDVFDMAQFKRQNGTAYRQEIEFKSLVAKTIATERQNTYQKGLQLSVELPNDEIYIQGDQSALENVVEKLLNFVTNYTPKGSEIRVSLAINSATDANYLEFEISSLGLELADSDLPQIFLPFYKSSQGSVRNTGLQLSVAKEIIGLHKGQISAYSDPQKGICFNIKLVIKRTSSELITT